MAGNDVQKTHPVTVKVFLRSGAHVSGTAHIPSGAYQRRLSDVLNLGQLRYIAITGASYQSGAGPATETDCVLINTQDISMIDATPTDPDDVITWEPHLPPAGSSI